MTELFVTSPAFQAGDWIPAEHTGRGADRSPPLSLRGLSPQAESLAVLLDDDSHPIFPHYNHWLIWNLPPSDNIPGEIPPGETVKELAGAVQGMAYGKHRYRGPKPPFHWNHSYTFTVYALDGMLSLPPQSRRNGFFEAVEGHVLQLGRLSGKFQSGRA